MLVVEVAHRRIKAPKPQRRIGRHCQRIDEGFLEAAVEVAVFLLHSQGDTAGKPVIHTRREYEFRFADTESLVRQARFAARRDAWNIVILRIVVVGTRGAIQDHAYGGIEFTTGRGGASASERSIGRR